MIWATIPFAPSYEVSEIGAVRNAKNGRLLKPCVLKRGQYLAVSLWANNRGKTWPVHQIVAITFHGPRPTPAHHAAHDNGDKTDNSRGNVLWKTKAENEADKRGHGTANVGVHNPAAKLTEQMVAAIRKAASGGESQANIGRRFGVEQSHLSRIISRQLWKDAA